MRDERKDLALNDERLQKEILVLPSMELNFPGTDWIDTFDNALVVLEDAQQVKPVDILEDMSEHS